MLPVQWARRAAAERRAWLRANFLYKLGILRPWRRRGRPPRFESPAAFLAEIAPLVAELEAWGDYPSADAVGDLAFNRGVIGGDGGDPGRVLQRWASQLFGSWRGFLAAARRWGGG